MLLYFGTAARKLTGAVKQVGTEENINSFSQDMEEAMNRSFNRFKAWIAGQLEVLSTLESRSKNLMMGMALYLTILAALGVLAVGGVMGVMAASLCALWLSFAVENGYAPVAAGIRQRYLVSTLLREGAIGLQLMHFFSAYLAQGLPTNIVLQSAMVVTLAIHAVLFAALILLNTRQPLFLRALAGVAGAAPALTAAAAIALGAASLFRPWPAPVSGMMSALGAVLAFLGDELIHIKNLGGIRLKYHSIWVCLLMIAGFTLMLCGAWTYAPLA